MIETTAKNMLRRPKRCARQDIILGFSFEKAPNLVHSTWRAIGQVLSIYLAIGSCAVTAQDNRPGRATFAEMIAYARLAGGACERLAPEADGFYARALMRLNKPPLTEKEIVAAEKDIKRLRDRLGLRKWCQRYAGEMAQARILVEALRRKQN
jgi:hypothetical protein